MKYIIIQHINPKQQALDVSEELWNISRPEREQSDVTAYLFSHIEHPGSGEIALVIDEDYTLRIHPESGISIDKIAQMLTHRTQQQEREQLKQYMKSKKRVRFGDIIPSTVAVKTKEEMEADGWFDYPIDSEQ